MVRSLEAASGKRGDDPDSYSSGSSTIHLSGKNMTASSSCASVFWTVLVSGLMDAFCLRGGGLSEYATGPTISAKFCSPWSTAFPIRSHHHSIIQTYPDHLRSRRPNPRRRSDTTGTSRHRRRGTNGDAIRDARRIRPGRRTEPRRECVRRGRVRNEARVGERRRPKRTTSASAGKPDASSTQAAS